MQIHILQSKCGLFEREVQHEMLETNKLKRIGIRWNIQKVEAARKEQNLKVTIHQL